MMLKQLTEVLVTICYVLLNCNHFLKFVNELLMKSVPDTYCVVSSQM